MELKFFLNFIILFGIKCVTASVNFTGLDIKNIKGKYKELENSAQKHNVNEQFLNELNKSNYKNINVIALSTSRHYFNYRHTSNLLIAYKYLKNLGDIMDKNIILMIPFDQACDCRNIIEGTIFKEYEHFPGESFDEKKENPNLYKNIYIDYKNNNVRDEQIRRVIRHRYDGFTPKKNRLYTSGDKKKNLFIYMTGHGGVNFLKIQEFNIMSSSEFNLYIQELLIKNIYKYIFVIIDTCQGYSFYDDVLKFIYKNKINNVFLLSSSNRTENSYSLFSSKYLSVSTVDRFTYNFFNYLENIYRIYPNEPYKNAKSFSMYNILNYLKTQNIMSEPTINNSKFSSSTFLHDKNILFYNSNFFIINKDFYESPHKYDYMKNKEERLSFQNECLGDLSFCGHIKGNIYTNMINLYNNRSYYSDIKVYMKEETHFADYYFTSKIFDTNNSIKILLALFFILFSILFFFFK
ncbi:GPI-anchor transamidase, putative [Plasmodium gallinaceum]|uniref:GPI-anchor transamidase, putative n=1 Tax=Plasmodium gallinaceum TaxID=5849 RepID=A0A1J1GV48_PLAGA|nr:GPI-anchor transamidase, putative [Plasmodium gallinaceum]CRG96338.1 GPI-anchor transamidase, putative [Plasmodium gallinaceum]